jgi:hypothetical protein
VSGPPWTPEQREAIRAGLAGANERLATAWARHDALIGQWARETGRGGVFEMVTRLDRLAEVDAELAHLRARVDAVRRVCGQPAGGSAWPSEVAAILDTPRLCPVECMRPYDQQEGRFCPDCQGYRSTCADDHCLDCGAVT